MKVSVIIPTYNRSQYLAQAIDTVLEQTFSDIELIVVDDGSTDDTKRVIDSYSGRIIYHYIPNSGPAVARNVGMELATGDYIAYLDSDDLYYPYKIELQVAYLDKYQDAVMVYSEFTGFDDDHFHDFRHLQTYHKSAYKTGAITYEQLFPKKLPVSDFSDNAIWHAEHAYMGHIYDAYLYNTVVFTNSMMFRRSLLAEIGLQSTQFGFFHDLEFALRVCKQGPVGFIDIPTYKLRYHPGQVSTLDSPKRPEVATRLQNDLLKVTETHTKNDTGYYLKNLSRVNQQLAKLARSVAIPLMGYAGDDKRAREYLAKCKAFGHPERLLWTLSYMPHIVRRIAFKLMEMKKSVLTSIRLKLRHRE